LLRDYRRGADFLCERQRVVVLLRVVEAKQLLICELCGEPLSAAVVCGKQGRVDLCLVKTSRSPSRSQPSAHSGFADGQFRTGFAE